MEHLRMLLEMAYHDALFSLFAVGGGIMILIPQVHQQFVVTSHWIDEQQFAELLAVSQAAPGPNFLLIPLIGWRVFGWAGAAVSMCAFLILPMTITFFVGRWLHGRENEWISRFRRAFRPITGGLWIASGIVVARATDHSLVPTLLTFVVLAVSLFVDISPFWWCVIAGVVGYVFV
jgi:chromate transporter